jgi:hypothetical protein
MSDFSEDESYQSDNHSTHSQSVHAGYNSREDLSDIDWSDIDNTSNNSGGDGVDNQNTTVPVKSTRQHRQPSWMRSDDWEM